MKFTNFNDLVALINQDLGVDFCNDFQYKRKELGNYGRTATKGQLFGNIHDYWAINEGGGTEVQYHISINTGTQTINYGIGFSAQYVQFKNQMSPVDYVTPFINSFLKSETSIRAILPDYDFLGFTKEELSNPQNGDFYLFGKSIPYKLQEGENFVDDKLYQQLLQDLQKQFEAYALIYEKKNTMTIIDSNIESYISLLEYKRQVIMQGPPGTGKTYSAKEVAYTLINNKPLPKDSEQRKAELKQMDKSGQFKIIQFHPAYSYEDFVRGIVAKTKGNAVEYTTVNKILADFAVTAYRNYVDSRKSAEQISEEKRLQNAFDLFVGHVETAIANNGKYVIKNEIYIQEIDEDAFRYKGDNWTTESRILFADFMALVKLNIKSRKEIKDIEGLSKHVMHRKTYYYSLFEKFKDFYDSHKEENLPAQDVKEQKYVLVIDEINRANLPAVLGELIYALEYRGESVDSMYPLEDGSSSIIIPPNMYIIGTMNTADRSVGHIDYAIRRRFAFIDLLPSIEPIPEFAHPLFREVSSLFVNYDMDNKVSKSEYLAPDFRFEDVWMGHSYFIAKDEKELNTKLNYEIIPLLKEYVKDGVLLDTAETKISKLHV